MPLFYRGAGVGTWWHTNDPRINGFAAHSPATLASPVRLMEHIQTGPHASPYISLTRSYGVALHYAMEFGRARPTDSTKAYVWEIELNDPLPPNLKLYDPLTVIAELIPSPLASISYQHDGAPTCLVGLIDLAQAPRLAEPRPMPPNANPPHMAPNVSAELKALMFALRDAEILAIGTIPAACVRTRYEVPETPPR